MKSVILYDIENFDICQIANSGQCFRMNPHAAEENTWQLIACGSYLQIRQEPGSSKVEFQCSRQEFEQIWKHYFDLEVNYQDYMDRIDPADHFLSAAVTAGAGIRILRQEIWEMIVSFMISQNNNIPRIKKNIEELCRRAGTEHVTESGQLWYEFPTPEALAALTEEQMRDAGLGYRGKYIMKLAEDVVSGKIVLQTMEDTSLTDTDIEKYLKNIYGIGPKVANCIMLFGLHRIGSFPKDTWINKIIREKYDGEFPLERYAGFAGIIQQYMFNYAANKWDKKKKPAGYEMV